MTAPIAPGPMSSSYDTPPAMFSTMRIASTGLSAQSFRMEIIAQNLANSETTRTPEGGPYQRRIVQLESEPSLAEAPVPTTTPFDPALSVPQIDLGTAMTAGAVQVDATGGVRIAGVGVDTSDGPMVYDPGHPDADANGYVRMPNVNMTSELMDLMSARRLFEANASVFEVAKAMLTDATQI